MATATKQKVKLTKEIFDKLFDPDIKKSEYDEIIGLCEERFWDIWTKAAKALGVKIDWYDFHNEAGEYSPGYFDPYEYDVEIGVTGKWSGQYEDEDLLSWFPTKYLWQDDEKVIEELLKEKERLQAKKFQKKSDAKAKREALKIKKAEMKKIIESKLTKEELKFIKFK